MGGKGSSRWGNYEKKTVVDSCTIFDIGVILKDGYLKRVLPEEKVSVVIRSIRMNRVGNPIVDYGIFSEKVIKSSGLKISITKTPTRFGGNRWWLLCPMKKGLTYCGRRAQRLYIQNLTDKLGCRTCHNLTYRSCQESYAYKKLNKSLSEF